jgi:hypothetical protein
MVEPAKTYNVVDIEYYQEGEGVQNLQSPSTLTLVYDNTLTAVNTALTKLIQTVGANTKVYDGPTASAAAASSTK